MSGVTIAQVQAMIMAKVGDTPTGTIAALLPVIWASYADKAQASPRLQALYTQREAFDIRVGGLQAVVNTTIDGLSKQGHQQIDTLVALRKATQDEITDVEKKSRGMRGAALQPLTNVAIETPPTGPRPFGPIDSNSPEIGGDPYYRTNGTTRGW